MAVIPLAEPSQIIAGDTIKWRREDLSSDYPASSWTLKYYFIKTGKQIIITASADGVYFSITIPKAASAAYPSGIYSWIAKVSKDGIEEFTIDSGTIEIMPDLTAQTSGYDNRTHAKKVLDAIESILENRATDKDLDFINKNFGTAASFSKNPELLIKWHNRYKQLYKQEQNAERIKNGLGTGNKVLTRFA